MHSPPSDSSGGSNDLLVEIIETLETCEIEDDAYQLHDYVDVEALEQLVASSHSPTEYRCRQERESGFSVPPVTRQDGMEGAAERQEQDPTRLYDQRGDSIRDESRLGTILDDAR